MDEHTIKCNTETKRNKEKLKNIKPIVLTNPEIKTRNIPSIVTNSGTERNSYGLGYHNRQHQNPGRPNHTHKPPATSHKIKLNQKGGCTWLFKEQMCIYVTFGQKDACIRGFWPKTYVYTWLLAKTPRMYVTFFQKHVYTEKTVVKIRPRVKPIKGSVNGWTYNKMQHRNKEKQR